jgi:anaerobic magnesium-protoporphyrin IX monomethyl ester cyclase
MLMVDSLSEAPYYATMNILLVNAPHTEDGERVRRFSRPWPPLDLLNCAALLRRDGHDVRLLDYRAMPVAATERDRAAAAADRIVVNTTPLDRWQCPTLDTEATFRFIRGFPGAKTWVAGAHGTMQPEWVLDESGAAGLLIGEPEAAIGRIASADPGAGGPGLATMQDDRVRSERAELLDLATLPVPAFDLLQIERYQYELLGNRLLVLETARGCPFGCTFCSREMYGKPVRRKSGEQVVAEIERATADTGFRHAYFIDLEFTFHREPVVALCEEILAREWSFGWTCQTRFDQIDEVLLRLMKRAGCRLIHFGVETGANRHIEALKKGLSLEQIREQHALVQGCGLETALFFLLGHSGETPAEQRATIGLACELNPDYASFNIVSPYPGTPFHETAGPFDEPFPPFDGHSHDLPALEGMRREALRSFYLRPRYMASRMHPRRLGSALRGARLLLRLMS